MLELKSFFQKLEEELPGNSKVNVLSDCPIYFERLSMDGLDEMHAYSVKKRFYEHIDYKPFTLIEETRNYLENLMLLESDIQENRNAIAWFVRKTIDKSLLGTARLVNLDYRRQKVEWGYGIDPDEWGRGYVFQIQEILKFYVFSTLKLNRLWSVTSKYNSRVISSLLASGFKKEGILRDYLKTPEGKYIDTVIYSLLASEYFEQNKKSKSQREPFTISKKEIIEIISNTISSTGLIEESDSMHTISSWDSLNHISIILEIEKKVDYKFSPIEISQAISIENIYNIINSKK